MLLMLSLFSFAIFFDAFDVIAFAYDIFSSLLIFLHFDAFFSMIADAFDDAFSPLFSS